MKNFEYIRPKSLQEASDYLASHPGDAIPFAGGTDVLGTLKDRVIAPESLVNLKDFSELRSVRYSASDGLRIGALVTINEIAAHPDIAAQYPILSQAAREIASPQLRNAGTLGGNLCQRPRCWYFRGDFHCLKKGGDMCYAFNGENRRHCIIGGGPCYIVNPSDTAVALLALNASVTIHKQGNTRDIPLRDLYILPREDVTRETVLKSGELITEVQVPPLPENSNSTYIKIKERSVWDFALVSVGAVLQSSNSIIESGRIAFGGVAPKPWEDPELNRQLSGLRIREDNFSKVGDTVMRDASPLEQNGYKVHLAKNVVRQVLRDLTG